MEIMHPLDRLFKTAEAHRVPMSRICERAGIAPTTPSRWKQSKTKPTVEKLFALETALAAIVRERTVKVP